MKKHFLYSLLDTLDKSVANDTVREDEIALLQAVLMPSPQLLGELAAHSVGIETDRLWFCYAEPDETGNATLMLPDGAEANISESVTASGEQVLTVRTPQNFIPLLLWDFHDYSDTYVGPTSVDVELDRLTKTDKSSIEPSVILPTIAAADGQHTYDWISSGVYPHVGFVAEHDKAQDALRLSFYLKHSAAPPASAQLEDLKRVNGRLVVTETTILDRLDPLLTIGSLAEVPDDHQLVVASLEENGILPKRLEVSFPVPDASMLRISLIPDITASLSGLHAPCEPRNPTSADEHAEKYSFTRSRSHMLKGGIQNGYAMTMAEVETHHDRLANMKTVVSSLKNDSTSVASETAMKMKHALRRGSMCSLMCRDESVASRYYRGMLRRERWLSGGMTEGTPEEEEWDGGVIHDEAAIVRHRSLADPASKARADVFLQLQQRMKELGMNDYLQLVNLARRTVAEEISDPSELRMFTYFLMGKPPREVALLMGQKGGTIRSDLHRMLERLKKRFSAENDS